MIAVAKATAIGNIRHAFVAMAQQMAGLNQTQPIQITLRRQARRVFKLAVELAVTMNVVAASQNIDKVSLERLRGECVKEVKRMNGSFTFDDAYDWQKG